MTIHHDKIAYGKLANMSEEISNDKLKSMLTEINSECKNSESNDEKAEKNKDFKENKKI